MNKINKSLKYVVKLLLLVACFSLYSNSTEVRAEFDSSDWMSADNIKTSKGVWLSYESVVSYTAADADTQLREILATSNERGSKGLFFYIDDSGVINYKGKPVSQSGLNEEAESTLKKIIEGSYGEGYKISKSENSFKQLVEFLYRAEYLPKDIYDSFALYGNTGYTSESKIALVFESGVYVENRIAGKNITPIALNSSEIINKDREPWSVGFKSYSEFQQKVIEVNPTKDGDIHWLGAISANDNNISLLYSMYGIEWKGTLPTTIDGGSLKNNYIVYDANDGLSNSSNPLNYYGRTFWLGMSVDEYSTNDTINQLKGNVKVYNGGADQLNSENFTSGGLPSNNEHIVSGSWSTTESYGVNVVRGKYPNATWTVEISAPKSNINSVKLNTGLIRSATGETVGAPAGYGDSKGLYHKVEMNSQELLNFMTSGLKALYNYDVPDPTDNSRSLTFIMEYNIKITNDVGATIIFDNSTSTQTTFNDLNRFKAQGVAIPSTDVTPALSPKSGNGLYTNTGASIWSFNSAPVESSWAEVVANIPGESSDGYPQDWNVASGIPSTERLSIVSGGQNYMFNLSGYIQKAPATQRTITFRIKITDDWDSNTRCTLGCGGHTVASATCGQSISPTKGSQTNAGEIASLPPGAPVPPAIFTWEYTCPVCGTSAGSAESPTNPGSRTCAASSTATFNCSSGIITASGVGTATGSTSINSTKQRYNLTGGTLTCGATTVPLRTVINESLTDRGWTTGKGCACSHTQNMIHPGISEQVYQVVQEVPAYAYRELTNIQVWALADASITGFDDTLFGAVLENKHASANVGEDTIVMSAANVSNSNLYVDAFRAYGNWSNTTGPASSSYSSGAFNGGNGRLLFTIFKDDTGGYEKLGYLSGVKYGMSKDGSSTLDTQSGLLYLSNPCYEVTIVADSTYANNVAGSCQQIDSDPTGGAAHIQNRGVQENHGSCNNGGMYSNGTPAPSPIGSNMTDAQRKNVGLALANYWQWNNNDPGYLHQINVVSDCISAGVSTATNIGGDNSDSFQNVVGEMYGISTSGGIPMFTKPFTKGTSSYRYDYSGVVSADSAASNILNGTYSRTDINESSSSHMSTGYLGFPSPDSREKYLAEDYDIERLGTKISGIMETLPIALQFMYKGEICSYNASSLSDCINKGLGQGTFNININNGSGNPKADAGGAFSAYPGWSGVTNAFGAHTNFDPKVDHKAFTAGFSRWDQVTLTYGKSDIFIHEYMEDVDSKLTNEGYYGSYVYPYLESGDINLYTMSRVNYTGSTPLTLQGTDLGNMFYLNDKVSPYNDEFTWYLIDLLHSGNGVCFPFTTDYMNNGVSTDYWYGAPLAMTSIPMDPYAPNGAYSNPLTVSNNYRLLANFTTRSTEAATGFNYRGPKSYNAEYTSGSGGLNTIVIHNPISTQYADIIGNNYGSVQNGFIDNTGEDFRTDSVMNNLAENDKDNYIVIGNEFNLWVSDFGDFKDEAEGWDSTYPTVRLGVSSSEDGANILTGEINQDAKGYVDNMNTGRWTKTRWVQFPFAVSTWVIDTSSKDADGKMKEYLKIYPANEPINLSNVMVRDANGNACYVIDKKWPDGSKTATDGMDSYGNSISVYTPASDKLQDFVEWDSEFKYGLNYAFTCLSSAREQKNAEVYIFSEAINNVNDVISTSYGYSETNNNRAGNYAANHVTQHTSYVDVVGRIGNLTLEDTEDFRFSNLFKTAEDIWLITDVIKKVNDAHPKNVLSTTLDIFMDNAKEPDPLQGGDPYNHNTVSITSVKFGDNYDLGKAGDFLTLPLRAANNPVEEFKSDQIKMGYNAFWDIETIGNYYGVNIDENGYLDRGPLSYEDLIDKRKYTMTITPHYLLWDYELEEYIPINMYAGSAGAYELFYSDTMNNTTGVSSLYVDLQEEKLRRNTTGTEEVVTDAVVEEIFNGNVVDAFDEIDYIGSPAKIVLDQYNRTFIGSSVLRGTIYQSDLLQGIDGLSIKGGTSFINSSNTSGDIKYDFYANPAPHLSYSGLAEQDFAQQSQRWYFSLGLPSSTIITEQSATVSQLDIEKKHEEFQRKHPNSTLVGFFEISVSGDTWDLTYDGKEINKDPDLPLFVDDDGNEYPPEPWDSTWKPVIENYRDPDVDGTPDIPDSWIPGVIIDPWIPSTSDWDTYGTH